MMENLELLQLYKLRELVNAASQKKVDHIELKKLLKRQYALSRDAVAEVLAKVEGLAQAEAKDDVLPESIKEINLYVELLGLKLRAYDPQKPDLKKLKTAVNNKIFALKKVSKQE